eukprot:TRINITY_DN15283_c0_g1_i1.p1 TRINITY_DN15283_c0_g1~~TRINITY_DN15283_c0_g1_i1.p1  ORF type:complete len:617 (+),score=96.28 TRINITY_DN15283_c0_g1_i1:72-1853(+)
MRRPRRNTCTAAAARWLCCLPFVVQGEDECVFWDPCPDQRCVDANTTGLGQDFICQCANGIQEVGGPALCELDECAEPLSGWDGKKEYKKPCGPNQECKDPNTAANQRFDFVCTCKTGGATAVGTWARCQVNECDAPAGMTWGTGPLDNTYGPCGTEQTCEDTNLAAYSSSQTPLALGLRDFKCKCKTGAGEETGKPAVCEQPAVDECSPNPCGQNQTCVDPSNATGDFVCSCDHPYIGARKGAAVQCHLDDCWQGSVKKCGGGQYCEDKVTAGAHTNQNLHDFVCRCISPLYGFATGRQGACMLDDCDRPGQRCTASNQECTDIHYHSNNVGMYQCRCPNQVEAINRPANCTIVEPCPEEQKRECSEQGKECVDADDRGNKFGSFRCGAPLPPEDDSDDSSMPWWVIALVVLAILCVIAFIALAIYKRSQIQTRQFAAKNASASELKTTPYQQVKSTPAHAQGQFLTVPGAGGHPLRKSSGLLTPTEAGSTGLAGAVAGALAADKARARRASPAGLSSGGNRMPGIVITCKPSEGDAPPSPRGSPRVTSGGSPRARRSPGDTTSPTGQAQGPGFGTQTSNSVRSTGRTTHQL